MMYLVNLIKPVIDSQYGLYILFSILPFLFICIRVCYLIYFVIATQCNIQRKGKLKTMLVMGSGGHTAELIRLIKCLNSKKYAPRLYIIATNDLNSEVKIHELEDSLHNKDYTIHKIPRSRNVNQSYYSSILSTANAVYSCLGVVFNFKPDIVICNGPGTCVPVCAASFLSRVMFVTDCRIIFIESICRVQTLSLTGKILQFFADIFIVQWPQLRDSCFRAKYFGRLT